jgi:hypothetical protein
MQRVRLIVGAVLAAQAFDARADVVCPVATRPRHSIYSGGETDGPLVNVATREVMRLLRIRAGGTPPSFDCVVQAWLVLVCSQSDKTFSVVGRPLEEIFPLSRLKDAGDRAWCGSFLVPGHKPSGVWGRITAPVGVQGER